MWVSCPGTYFTRKLSDSTATTNLHSLGEACRAYCEECEDFHWFRVKR